MAKSDADVVFATSTPLTVAIPAAFARLRHGRPVVFEVRDLWPAVPIHLGALKQGWMRWAASSLERLAYDTANQIVVFSPAMAAHIQERVRPQAPVSVIPNGADIEFFRSFQGSGRDVRKRFKWLGSRPLLCYIGTLGVVNQAEYAVSIAEKLSTLAPEICVVIIGDGKRRAAAEDRARNSGILGTNIWFMGPLAKSEVGAWFDAADATLALLKPDPYLWQFSFPNKFFDSLAAGRPVVTNHPRGGKADVIRESGAGLCIHPDDPAVAARELAGFIQDKSRVRSAVVAAKTLGHHYSRESVTDQLERVLDSATRRVIR